MFLLASSEFLSVGRCNLSGIPLWYGVPVEAPMSLADIGGSRKVLLEVFPERVSLQGHVRADLVAQQDAMHAEVGENAHEVQVSWPGKPQTPVELVPGEELEELFFAHGVVICQHDVVIRDLHCPPFVEWRNARTAAENVGGITADGEFQDSRGVNVRFSVHGFHHPHADRLFPRGRGGRREFRDTQNGDCFSFCQGRLLWLVFRASPETPMVHQRLG